MTEKPRAAPDTSVLPHPLTFFMTAGERAAVLRRLRRHGPDRRLALLSALGAREQSPERKRRVGDIARY